jgi:hypothetical protein
MHRVLNGTVEGSSETSHARRAASTGLTRGVAGALASGIVFGIFQFAGAIVFASYILPRLAPMDAPAAEQAAAYVAHANLLRLGNYAVILPAPFFLFFLAGLYAVLRRPEGERGVLASTAAFSGVAMSMIWAISAVVSDIAIDIALGKGDAVTISALNAFPPYMLALSALPRAVLLAATACVVLQGRDGSRWLGWSGIGIAVLSLAGSATLANALMFPVLALSTLLFDLWLAVLCSVWLREETMSWRS